MAAAVDERSLRKTDVVTTGFGAVEGIPSSGSRGIARKSRRKTTSRRFSEEFEELKRVSKNDWREPLSWIQALLERANFDRERTTLNAGNVGIL